LLLLAAFVAATAGCDGDDTTGSGSSSGSSSSGGGQGGQGGSATLPPIVDLMVDTNRDGYPAPWAPPPEHDFTLDSEGEDTWSLDSGAVFLANIDDDNLDGIKDADDAVINDEGEVKDSLDLARIRIRPWPEVPAGATGELRMDPDAFPHVRIFKHVVEGSNDSWELVIGSDGQCTDGANPDCTLVSLTDQEIADGVELGIEAKRYAGTPAATVGGVPWSGIVRLSFSIFEAGSTDPVTTDDVPDGIDVAELRVAPWIMFGNLTATPDELFANTPSLSFINGVEAAIDDYNAQNPETEPDIRFHKINNWQDHWTQDYFQTGFSSLPRPDGAAHGIRVAMPRPWGRSSSNSSLPRVWLQSNHLSPDSSYQQIYLHDHTGTSLDSYGNHDLVPPHDGYPYGRIILGGYGSPQADTTPLPETLDWYDANLVQGPYLMLDTYWLWVGHIDEVFSYVPADTERGWKLLVASPRLARQMLEDWQAQGYGNQIMFQGQQWYNGSNAEITINQVLADSDLAQWNQVAQNEIDSMLAGMVAAVGVAHDEIIEIPFLFDEAAYGYVVAYIPDTINSLVYHDYFVAPDPFGPMINGVDGFKADLEERLGPDNQVGRDGQGMHVFFVDNWDWYHALDGEVHCGTNTEGPPQPDVRWWEVMQ